MQLHLSLTSAPKGHGSARHRPGPARPALSPPLGPARANCLHPALVPCSVGNTVPWTPGPLLCLHHLLSPGPGPLLCLHHLLSPGPAPLLCLYHLLSPGPARPTAHAQARPAPLHLTRPCSPHSHSSPQPITGSALSTSCPGTQGGVRSRKGSKGSYGWPMRFTGATQPIPVGRQRPGLDRAPGLIGRAGHTRKLYIKQLQVMSRLMTLRVRV